MTTPEDAPRAQYVSPAEASRIVAVSVRTLRRAIRAGRLRAHTLGRLVRIELGELDRWVKANDTATAPSAAHGDRR